MNYSHRFGSNFPNEVIPIGSKQDINNAVKTLVSQYYSQIDAGNIAGANVIYETYKDLLEPYIVNSAYFNQLEEEIYNVGVAVLNNITTVVSDEEPLVQETYSNWLKEW